MESMEEPLSLQSHCFLSIISHCASYPASALSLIPPRLRALIAHSASPYDLHRLEHEENGIFFSGLENRVKMGDLWRRRYENTLLKFSNVSGLDIDMETHLPSANPSSNHHPLSLSWKDRYLMACLLNTPRIYPDARLKGISPPGEGGSLKRQWGVAIFGLADIVLPNGQFHKERVGCTRHGLHCFSGQRDNPGTLASQFVSENHVPLLQAMPPFNQPVGSEWPILERLKLFSSLFPCWRVPYVPVLVDRETDLITESVGGKIDRAIIYSGWYETRSNAEISEADSNTKPLCLSSSFKAFFESHSSEIETLVFLPPAVLKREGGNYSRLNVSTTTLVPSVTLSLPILRHLSITMHACDTKFLSILPHVLPPLYHTLTTLHLKVVRPKFPTPSLGLGLALRSLYENSQLFQDLILQGLYFDETEFADFMLSYLSTPKGPLVHESVTLRNVKISESGKGVVAKRYVMPQNCNKSLFTYRLLNTKPLSNVLAGYEEIRMNVISFIYSLENILIPPDLKLTVDTVRIERIILNEESFELLKPLLAGNVTNVELSFARPFPLFSMYRKCFEVCSKSLSYLDLNWCLPDVFKELSELEAFFAMLFSLLTPHSISRLELNLVQFVKNYASYLTTKENNSGIWLDASFMKPVEGKNMIRTWNCLHKSWRENANGCKLKCLHVTVIALDEVYDELVEMAMDLIEDI